MILRKPFAFFIKHFKLIHLVLTIVAIFLLAKTNHILSFFLEYTNFLNVSPSSSVSINLFGSMLSISILIMILGSSLIAFLMKSKNKPIIFYVVNIVLYFLLAIIYIISYSMIQSLEIGMVDIRTLKLFQDILGVTFIVQIISIVILTVRTLGFDIKKFDFDRDLEVLDISSEDNEEVEIDLKFDTDHLKRTIRKKYRHFKYIYAENKIILNIVFGIILVILGILLYLQIGVYHQRYLQNQTFDVTNYTMNIKNSYAVNTDLNGSIIDPNATFVLAEIQVKGMSPKEINFQKARLSLQIQDHLFYHQKDYQQEFSDLGTVYIKQKISNKKQTYLFVFQIPNDYKNKKMVLQYKDYNNKTIRVRLRPNYFNHTKSYQYQLKDTVSFKDSILKNTTVQINSVEIKDIFKHQYQFCLDKEHCTNSYEYLVPTYTGTQDKALLKITGTLQLDENKQIENVRNLYQFIERYGSFYYTVDGKEKEMKTPIKQVKPHKNLDSDTYYIEIDKEMKQANQIILQLHIRDKEYQYTVK